MSQHILFHLHGASNHLSSDPVVFQVVPHLLIRIQSWRVWRQKIQPQTLRVLSHKLPDFFRLVRRVPVYDQEDRMFGLHQQPLQKLDEHPRVDSSLDAHKPEKTLSVHLRNQVESESCPCTRLVPAEHKVSF